MHLRIAHKTETSFQSHVMALIEKYNTYAEHITLVNRYITVRKLIADNIFYEVHMYTYVGKLGKM